MRQTIATKGYQAREKQNGRRPTAVGPGAPSASSKPPRRPPVVLPEKQPYPTRSTNNDRLMLGIRACVAFDVPQAAPLCIAIQVRCGGKGYCLPSTAVWMGDTDASQHTVERWRSILTETGLIEMQSAAIRTNVRATFVMKMVRSKAKAEADAVEVPPYPRGSTDNELLMKGARVLVGHKASEAFEAFALYVAIVVRCGGKGHYWASSAVWKRDTGASQLSVERWRSILVRVGLIVVEHRGNKSGMIRLTALAGFRLRLLPPEPDPAGDDVSGASRTATYEGASTLIVGGTEAPNRNLRESSSRVGR